MNERILVVEDNEKNLYLMKFMLQKAGYQVIEATDGEKGYQKAVSELPDLVIMDMQLPIMDGYEATAKIKKNPRTSKVPVIALTAYAMRGDREKSIAAGCDDYMKKPIDPVKFLAYIEKFLTDYKEK